MKSIYNIFKRKTFNLFLSFFRSSWLQHIFLLSSHYLFSFQQLNHCLNLKFSHSFVKLFSQHHFHSTIRFLNDQKKIDSIDLLFMNRTIFKLRFFILSLTFHRQNSHRRSIQINMFSIFSRFFCFQVFSNIMNDHSKTSEKSFLMMRNFHSRYFQNLLFHQLKFFLNFKIAFEKLLILFI